MRDRQAEHNTVDPVEQRFDYARWLMGPNVVKENNFFIDEFEENIHTMRNKEDRKRRPSLPESIWSTRTKYHGLFCCLKSPRASSLSGFWWRNDSR